MTSRSDSPPPFQVPKISPSTGEHQLLPSCSAAFASIETTLKTVTSEVKGMRGEVQDIGKIQFGQAESLRGVWKEISEEINPGLKDLPKNLAKDIREHEIDCPARRRAMKKAEGGTGDDIDVRQLRENLRDDTTGVVTTSGRHLIRNSGNGHYEVPRPVLWIGAMIGAAIAASGYVLMLLRGM